MSDRWAVEGNARIVKLIGNGDFWWFMQKCVIEEQARLDGIIHDRRAAADAREAALNEWTALERVKQWPQQYGNDCGTNLGHQHRIVLDFSQPIPKSADTTTPSP